MSSTHQEHTRDDLWKRLNDQGDRIGEIRSYQAAADAKLGALEAAMEAGFRTISTELRHLSERVHQPPERPNVGIWISAIAVMLGVFGGYALLITGPIKELTTLITQANASRIEYHQERVDILEGERQRIAALEAKVDILQEQAKETRDFQAGASYIHGQREELGNRVEDIDNSGSRRWNNNSPPVDK